MAHLEIFFTKLTRLNEAIHLFLLSVERNWIVILRLAEGTVVVLIRIASKLKWIILVGGGYYGANPLYELLGRLVRPLS